MCVVCECICAFGRAYQCVPVGVFVYGFVFLCVGVHIVGVCICECILFCVSIVRIFETVFVCMSVCVSVYCLCERCVYNCANVSICVVTAQCLSVHLCVCVYIYLPVCVPARVGTGVRCRHAPPPPRNPPHCAPLAQEQRRRPGAPGERAARCCHGRRATLPFKSVSKPITADLPRDVLPSVSRSELPEDSPPDLPRVAPPQPAAGSAAPATLGKAAGGPGALPGPLSRGTPEAPGTSPGQEGGGSGGERARTQPSAPRTRAAPRPGGRPGCPVRSVWKGGALCQPGLQRAGPGGSRPGDGCEAGVSPPPPCPHHAEKRALQRGARPVPGLPGPQGGHQARLPEQEGSRSEPLAREVVRPLPECALLLRGRAERPPGGHVPPGGLQLRAGARAAQGRCRTRRRPGRAGQAGTTRPPSQPPCLWPRHSQTLLTPEVQGSTKPWVHARASPAALAARNLHAPPRLHPSFSPPPCHQWE